MTSWAAERIYFENAGGSLRLKAATEAAARVDAIPDSAERIHEVAAWLKQVQLRGLDDVRTDAQCKGRHHPRIAHRVGRDVRHDPRRRGERAGAQHRDHDARASVRVRRCMRFTPSALGKELRVARSNPATGGIDVDEIVRLVDAQTCVLVLIQASNISGAKLDLAQVVRRAREIKPDLYVIVDAVQHAPHGLIDVQKTPVDGINIAPYKFFGCRGSGFSWLSDRAAVLPHHRLAGKRPDFWDLGSAAPWQFAVISEIVDYVCWIGGHFTVDTDTARAFRARHGAHRPARTGTA